MKKFMFHTLFLSLAVALLGCGGSGDEPQPTPTVSITVSLESISAPAGGGTYTISVSTTGKEWGAYAEPERGFIVIDSKNTTSQSGSVTVTVAANPLTETRTGTVTIMSGSARKTINVTQEAAAESPYYAPDG